MKKEKTINLNGTFYDPGNLISSGNRAFLYGDSIFESIRYHHEPLLWELHFSRLLRAAAALGYYFAPWWTEDYFRYELIKTMKQNRMYSGRIRLVLFRNEESSGYAPQRDHCSYLIDPEPIEGAVYPPCQEGLTVGLFEDFERHPSPFSFFKSGQSLPYFMAARKAKKEHWDDALILNSQKRICESSNSNIWVLIGNEVHTPPIEEACIDGVMRKYLIGFLEKQGLKVLESPMHTSLIQLADEIWLSNAIQGIRWIKEWEFRRLSGEKALFFQTLLQKELTNHDKENSLTP